MRGYPISKNFSLDCVMQEYRNVWILHYPSLKILDFYPLTFLSGSDEQGEE